MSLSASDARAMRDAFARPGYMHVEQVAVTIASGAAVSNAIRVPSPAPRGWVIDVPAEWTAANIGFEVSDDKVTWLPFQAEVGTRIKVSGVTIDAAKSYIAPPETWALGAYKYVRLASLDAGDGTAENQGAARALTVRMIG